MGRTKYDHRKLGGAIAAQVLLFTIQASILAIAYAESYTPPIYTKGLQIHIDALKGKKSVPSLTEMKEAGFDLVGTHAKLDFTLNDWKLVEKWIKSLHSAGFGAYTIIKEKPDQTAGLIRKSVAIGADVVILDEPIARWQTTEEQLVSLIDTGLKASPRLQIIVTEFSEDNLNKAYAWTAGYLSVRVASDNYSHIEIIDVSIQLAAHYGKRALVWLLFVPGSKDFDNYSNFGDWAAFVSARGVDALFWKVDTDGNWRKYWDVVASYGIAAG